MSEEVLSVLESEYSNTIEGIKRVLGTGFAFDSPKLAFQLLDKINGIFIKENGLVSFAWELVQRALESTPRDIVLSSRSGKSFIVGGDHDSWLCLGGEMPNVIDSKHGIRRATIADLIEALRISQEYFHAAAIPLSPIEFEDPSQDREVLLAEKVKTALASAGKLHLVTVPLRENAIKHVLEKSGSSIKQNSDEPILSFTLSVTRAPRVFEIESIKTVLESARLGVPVAISIAPIMGSTSPFDIEGAMIHVASEFLALNTIVQHLQPGTKLMINPAIFDCDMRTGNSDTSSLRQLIASNRLVSLIKFLGIPANVSLGGPVSTEDGLYEHSRDVLCSAIIENSEGVGFRHVGSWTRNALTALSLERLKFAGQIRHRSSADIFNWWSELCNSLQLYDNDFSWIEEVSPGDVFLACKQTLTRFRPGIAYELTARSELQNIFFLHQVLGIDQSEWRRRTRYCLPK